MECHTLKNTYYRRKKVSPIPFMFDKHMFSTKVKILVCDSDLIESPMFYKFEKNNFNVKRLRYNIF